MWLLALFDALSPLLTLSQTTNFRRFQTQRVCRRQFKFDKNVVKFSKWVKNTVGKRRNCSLRAISPFSHSVFKRCVLQKRKNKGLFGKELKGDTHFIFWGCRTISVHHDPPLASNLFFSVNVYRSTSAKPGAKSGTLAGNFIVWNTGSSLTVRCQVTSLLGVEMIRLTLSSARQEPENTCLVLSSWISNPQ